MDKKNILEGRNKEDVLEKFKKQNPDIVVDFSNPVSSMNLLEDTPYILCQYRMNYYVPEYKETYKINNVFFRRSLFRRSPWDNTFYFYFEKEEEDSWISISNHGFTKGYVQVYDYTEEYACK